jgi:beta-glucosidase
MPLSTTGIVIIITIVFFIIYVVLLKKYSLQDTEFLWDWQKLEPEIDAVLREPTDKEFLWGTATAAHQVEGNLSKNNWYWWEHQTDAKGNPRIHRGQKSGKACEHWERYPKDIELMSKELGINSYRFSIEWSRIEPQEGVWDQDAIDHYGKMIDCMLENGIHPMATLHHFSHPMWFEEKGSFEKQENIILFQRFAEKIFAAYSDRVQRWCTHNECGPFATMGWGMGVFPPGKNDPALVGQVLLNLMRSHNAIYHSLKSMPNGNKVDIGLVKNIFQFHPWHRWNLIHVAICSILDDVYNESIIRTIRDGVFSIDAPKIKLYEEMPDIKGATDFIGLNYYSNLLVKLSRALSPFTPLSRPGQIVTDFPYTTYPEGFYSAIQRISTLNKPIIITENGIPDNKDDRREDWIRRYLYVMKKAMNEGIDIQGYHYWSFMDNFEWAEGYDMRFGLYEVNFETQERKLRQGAKLYQEIVSLRK